VAIHLGVARAVEFELIDERLASAQFRRQVSTLRNGRCGSRQRQPKDGARKNREALRCLRDAISETRHALVSGRRAQSTVEEVAGRAIGFQPGMVQQEVVDFVRENKLFDVYATLAQPRR
jgi:hypothetical protein